ncbi:MAG: hypothetical protein R3C04_12275 [Hyphomonas sp.]
MTQHKDIGRLAPDEIEGFVRQQIAQLPNPKHRHGSLPRCLMLTDDRLRDVAGSLNTLVGGIAHVPAENLKCAPHGFQARDEIELHSAAARPFLSDGQRQQLQDWWLVNKRGAGTPVWDSVVSAEIQGQTGLILIEAKAHSRELHRDGKKPGDPTNHQRIGDAIREASEGLNASCPGFALSRDSHYQLANRFAWGWKLASMGVPVVLVYLGFLEAEEMQSNTSDPIRDDVHWNVILKDYCAGQVPEDAWDREFDINGTPFFALRRTIRIDLPE